MSEQDDGLTLPFEYVVTPKSSGTTAWQWDGPAIAWEQGGSVISWEA